MSAAFFKYALTLAYAVLVYWLSYIGMCRTRSVEGFAIGNKDMSPYVVGITMAASIASTATFVVLILVACSLQVTGLLPVEQKTALILVLLFVFSYVLMGGSYAHAFTNTL